MRCWRPEQLQELIDRLLADDYRVLGPRVDELAMVYDEIDSLPVGWGDTQEAGHYRLRKRQDQSRFGYNLGPHTWKQFLFPPRENIFRVRDGNFISARTEPQKMAFIGVRACELSAIAIQDKVFTGPVPEPGYKQRRDSLLVVAVNCSQAAASCFCDSTGDGPEVNTDADLILTEFDPDDPWYLVQAGSPRGECLLKDIPGTAATDDADRHLADLMENTRQQMHRKLDKTGLPETLLTALDHSNWSDVADRCLACGNCTQVCPTCFCSSARDDQDLNSGDVTRVRYWESCFNEGHSYVAGGIVHGSVRSRYRQWLTHKLASWELQYGSSGCTGCGRCISWCPVGIDLTEEVSRFRSPS